MDLEQARPSYVTFAVVAEEDRTATIANGHYTAKDVAYAYITPAGSKDRIVRNAEEWVAQLDNQVREDRIPRDWAREYKEAYAAWKEGREVPLKGVSVRNWPSASPAQVEMLLNLRLRTVEDVAQANEETLLRIGMGARALKQLAVEWLQNAGSTGKVVEEIVELKTDNLALANRNNRLNERIEELAQQVENLTKLLPQAQSAQSVVEV